MPSLGPAASPGLQSHGRTWPTSPTTVGRVHDGVVAVVGRLRLTRRAGVWRSLDVCENPGDSGEVLRTCLDDSGREFGSSYHVKVTCFSPEGVEGIVPGMVIYHDACDAEAESADGCTDWGPAEGEAGSFWLDSDGDSCAKYKENQWCAQHGDGFANEDGSTANQACCVCGGGDPFTPGSGDGSSAPVSSTDAQCVLLEPFLPEDGSCRDRLFAHGELVPDRCYGTADVPGLFDPRYFLSFKLRCDETTDVISVTCYSVDDPWFARASCRHSCRLCRSPCATCAQRGRAAR